MAGCALALAACGSAGKPAAAGGSNASASFLAFSVCMRSHGVPSFPDPGPGGGIKLAAGSGLDPRSPTFQSAQQSCKHVLPGGGPPAHVSESDKLAALSFAQCMRAHGVPNFPDPTFPAAGGTMQGAGGSTEVNPDSPAFQQAAKACPH